MKLEHVELIPRPLDPDTLYVSDAYKTAIHLCACGCGLETVTPLGPSGWTLRDGTLHPSILNRRCGSHYWIRDGEVKWC